MAGWRGARCFGLRAEEADVDLVFSQNEAEVAVNGRAVEFFDENGLGKIAEGPGFEREAFDARQELLPGIGAHVLLLHAAADGIKITAGGDDVVAFGVENFNARLQVRGQALRRPVFGADVDAVAARDEIGERGEEVIATRIEAAAISRPLGSMGINWRRMTLGKARSMTFASSSRLPGTIHCNLTAGEMSGVSCAGTCTVTPSCSSPGL